jgi:hypothetical protein
MRIELVKNVGSISGRVTGNCLESNCANAKVTATNGQQSWTVAVSSPGGALPSGGYLITDLPPGSYTVTVSDTGMNQQTGLVSVTARIRSHQNLAMTRAG